MLTVDRATARRPDSITLAAAALHLGAGTLDALVDALPIGVALVDASGHTVYANAAARRWGVDRLADVHTVVARALRTNAAASESPIETRRVDGCQQWLAATVRPLRGADGRARAATVIVADVSDATQLALWESTLTALARP